MLKNNERISHAKSTPDTDPPSDVQDQGFTRPSVLILAPFRSHALDWAASLLAQLPALAPLCGALTRRRRDDFPMLTLHYGAMSERMNFTRVATHELERLGVSPPL